MVRVGGRAASGRVRRGGGVVDGRGMAPGENFDREEEVGEDEVRNGVRVTIILAGRAGLPVLIIFLFAALSNRGEAEGEDDVGEEFEGDEPSSLKYADGRIGNDDDLKNRLGIDDDEIG